jgi:hypothetical protein
VVLALSAFQPAVLVAVAFLLFTAVFGLHGIGSVALAVLAMTVTVTGTRVEALWWVERGWALIVAGLFAAVTFRRPAASFSGRALGAVAGAAGATGLFLAFQPGAWSTVDWAVRDRMGQGVTTALEMIRVLGGGEAVPPSLAAAVYETVELQGDLFPATLCLASVAGLGVAWWAYRRVARGDSTALGPLGGFRFNDHLVWVLLGALVLAVTRWTEAVGRLGENGLAFMAALYAVRGAAVFWFVSGGLSLFGWATLLLGLVLVPPLVLVAAMVVGIGDTWLDFRARFRDATA